MSGPPQPRHKLRSLQIPRALLCMIVPEAIPLDESASASGRSATEAKASSSSSPSTRGSVADVQLPSYGGYKCLDIALDIGI